MRITFKFTEEAGTMEATELKEKLSNLSIKIRLPIHPAYAPEERFINWHMREVFREPARYRMSGY
jgi:hypothetical protein